MNDRNRKIYYWGGFWTIVGTVFISHTFLSIPPALFIIAFTSTLALLLIGSGDRKIPIFALVTIPFIVYLCLTQPFTSANFRNIVGPIAGAFFFTVAIYFLNRLEKTQIIRIVHFFIVASIILLTFETIYRYLFPDQASLQAAYERGKGFFYQYKMLSLMYSDSNMAAIHMVIILFFTYYWAEITKKKYKGAKFILIFLIGLSLSRAAWLSIFIGIIYFKFLRNKSAVFWITGGVITLALTSLALFGFILPMVKYDDSFLMKFQIANQIFDYYKQSPSIKEHLIGIGVRQSIELFGIYAHSFLVVQLIEMGIISLVLLLLMWLQFGYYSNWKLGIILVPFLIATLSATLSFMPSFYVAVAIMCYAEKSLKNENSVYNTIVSQ